MIVIGIYAVMDDDEVEVDDGGEKVKGSLGWCWETGVVCRWAWQEGLRAWWIYMTRRKLTAKGNEDVDPNKSDNTAEKREDVDEQREKGKCRRRERV